MRSRLLRYLRRVLCVLIVVYLGICLLMWILENRLVYLAQTATESWQEPPDPRIEEIWIESDSQQPVHGWYLACPDTDYALLMCHGNYGNVSMRGQSLIRLRDQLKASVFIFDYPGYGKSPGKPSETGCYRTARIALDWLITEKRFPTEKIILYGESLGGGVACELAQSHRFRTLLLVKTFTSLPDVARHRYPWLPVKMLMRNRFDNLEKLLSSTSPVFIAAATQDEIIPFAHSERLFQSAKSPKRLFPLEGQKHADRLSDEFYVELKQFLQQLDEKTDSD